MLSFSQRAGKTPIRKVFQIDELDHETRVALWNIVFDKLSEVQHRQASGDLYRKVTSDVWALDFRKPKDEEPHENRVWDLVKDRIQNGEWFLVLDVLESFVANLADSGSWQSSEFSESAANAFNELFQANLVGYRFVEKTLVALDSEIEVEALNQGLEDSTLASGTHAHLKKAIELFSDRKSPDYANSVKESISAIEALLKQLTGIGTLGKAIPRLKQAGLDVHPGLSAAWSSMYGWASQSEGIRHGGDKPSEVSQALAKYVLVSSSAFVSLICEEARSKNILK
ncbi:AbiJ-NTD4 domain-containing protein [Rhodoluna limnophila]|uniref:AbiJ-NTD4 domain-containing protein n=1 Tax=Rhodoluna limnophila TaxID=232537 RepID=UPI0011059EE2|nr:hypothetical protein [Rhodoluna limnophila]